MCKARVGAQALERKNVNRRSHKVILRQKEESARYSEKKKKPYLHNIYYNLIY